MKKFEAGFIGAGNMGGALALAAAKTAGGEQIAVSCSTADSTAAHIARADKTGLIRVRHVVSSLSGSVRFRG